MCFASASTPTTFLFQPTTKPLYRYRIVPFPPHFIALHLSLTSFFGLNLSPRSSFFHFRSGQPFSGKIFSALGVGELAEFTFFVSVLLCPGPHFPRRSLPLGLPGGLLPSPHRPPSVEFFAIRWCFFSGVISRSFFGLPAPLPSRFFLLALLLLPLLFSSWSTRKFFSFLHSRQQIPPLRVSSSVSPLPPFFSSLRSPFLPHRHPLASTIKLSGFHVFPFSGLQLAPFSLLDEKFFSPFGLHVLQFPTLIYPLCSFVTDQPFPPF